MKAHGATGGIAVGRLVIFIVILLGIASELARAQEASRTVDQTYQFDERGDAKIEFKFQLSRAQWERWKAEYGDHPDMLLRMTKYNMAAAVIDDFALDRDDTHRSAVARFKACALAQYRGNGQFEIQVPRNMKLVTGSGLEWTFTNSMSESSPDGESIVNITYRAKLPAKAHDAHIVNGNDFNRLVYSLEVSPSKPKTLLYSGAVLILAAAAAAIAAARLSEGSGSARSSRPTGQSPPALPPG